MSSEGLTYLLTMLLIFSVVVLGILLFIFIMLSIKKKKQEKAVPVGNIQTTESTKTASNVSSNTIQTKAYTTQNVKSFLDFDEIKDNMIVQDKGKKLVMVVQCQGVNYDLMSSMEKVSVEQGFVQFLNTLTRPVQLYIQSRKVNLDESLQNYNKRLKDIENRYNKVKLQFEQAQKNESLSKDQYNMLKLEYVRQKNLYDYTRDIINNTEKMSLNKNILTKNYYMAISYVPDNTENLFEKEELLDMAFSELYTNAQSLLRVLSVCGVTGRILDSTELADLLYVAYNRDASEVYGVDKAIKAGYDSLYVTAPDVIEKKMAELDKMMKERALELANNTIEDVTIRSRKRKELEEREKNIESIISEMAKAMIEENEAYIGPGIAKEAIEELKEKEEKKPKAKKTKTKKGA